MKAFLIRLLCLVFGCEVPKDAPADDQYGGMCSTDRNSGWRTWVLKCPKCGAAHMRFKRLEPEGK